MSGRMAVREETRKVEDTRQSSKKTTERTASGGNGKIFVEDTRDNIVGCQGKNIRRRRRKEKSR